MARKDTGYELALCFLFLFFFVFRHMKNILNDGRRQCTYPVAVAVRLLVALIENDSKFIVNIAYAPKPFMGLWVGKRSVQFQKKICENIKARNMWIIHKFLVYIQCIWKHECGSHPLHPPVRVMPCRHHRLPPLGHPYYFYLPSPFFSSQFASFSNITFIGMTVPALA